MCSADSLSSFVPSVTSTHNLPTHNILDTTARLWIRSNFFVISCSISRSMWTDQFIGHLVKRNHKWVSRLVQQVFQRFIWRNFSNLLSLSVTSRLLGACIGHQKPGIENDQSPLLLGSSHEGMNKTGNVRIDVILRSVRVTTVTVKNQQVGHIVSPCLWP